MNINNRTCLALSALLAIGCLSLCGSLAAHDPDQPTPEERKREQISRALVLYPELGEKVVQEVEEDGNAELRVWLRSVLPSEESEDASENPSIKAADGFVEQQDWVAATDAYLAAYEANPDLFDSGHLKAFREAGRMIELAQCFDEKKLRKMKEYSRFGDPDLANMMLTLAGELIRNTKTRPNGYELLKRVMKSQQRARDRVFRYHNFRWEDVPEPAYYLRTLFIPEDFTSEGDGWWRLSVGALPDHFGTPDGLLKDAEPLFRDRIALGKFADEIRVLADENPTWVAGWAFLAFIESKAGNHREAARVLRERFVDSDIEKMHCHAAWMIGIGLAGQDSDLDQVVIQLLEYSLRTLTTGDFKRPERLYRTSSGKVRRPQYGPLPGAPLRRWPIKDLARLYAKHDRRLEARQLLYGLVDPIDQHPLVEGYFPGTYNGGCGNRGSCIACHRGEKIFFDFVAKTDAMTDIGYPVDSLLSLARIDASFRNAFSSSRGWIDSSTEEGKRFNETDLSGKYQALYYFNEQQAKAKKALTPRMVIEALDLGTFRRAVDLEQDRYDALLDLFKRLEGDDEETVAMREFADKMRAEEKRSDDVVLNLMLSIRGEGKKAEATVFSPVVDILKLAVESKQRGAAEDIAELDKRLVALSEQHPKSIEAGIVATVFAFLRNDLDSAKDRLKRLQAITDYPEADGAAFWLVARHALQHDQTRIIGAVLAERALAAADTQPDSGLKEAILRERSGLRTK